MKIVIFNQSDADANCFGLNFLVFKYGTWPIERIATEENPITQEEREIILRACSDHRVDAYKVLFETIVWVRRKFGKEVEIMFKGDFFDK